MNAVLSPLTPPILTGGTGRCGTTIMARMLDRHPEVGRTQPWECRFVTDPMGLCDLIEARSGLHLRARYHQMLRGGVRGFEKRLRGKWFRRTAGNGKVVGLHQGIDEETLEHALAGFRRRFRSDGPAAARRLTHELLDPPVRRQGKQRWVESTPANAARVDTMLRIFPDLRLIHMVRDGRDVAASVAARYWGPDDHREALDLWESKMLAAGQAIARVPADRVLTVQLEDLVLRRRDETLHRVLDFLDLSPAPEVLAFHAREMPADRAHLQRWLGVLEGAERDDFAQRYEGALERLVRAGVPVPQ